MISDILYILMYLVMELINYLLAYTLIFNSYLTKSKKNWVLSVSLLIISHLAFIKLLDLSGSVALSIFTMLVIPIFLLRPIEKKNFLLYPFIIISASIIAISSSFIVAILLGKNEQEIVNGYFGGLFCESVSIIFLIIVLIFKKLRHIEQTELELNWKQYLLFYIISICSFLLLGSIQVVLEKTENDKLYNVVGVVISICCIVFIIVAIWQGIIVNKQIQSEEENKMYKNYIELQKEYYNQLIKQDEKIRDFKHDMNAHIAVISSYCDNNDISELKNYLNDVIRESAIFDIVNYTGNKSVDAVISQQIINAQQNSIVVNINGKLPLNISVSEFDLTTIISNLLKNAIEACEKIKDIDKRKISLDVMAFNSQIYISIKNPINYEDIEKVKGLNTSKNDKVNHGIGIKNVKRTVQKYNGIIEFKIDDNCFWVEVSI